VEQKKLIQEFTNKGWGLRGLKKLMKKLREKLVQRQDEVEAFTTNSVNGRQH